MSAPCQCHEWGHSNLLRVSSPSGRTATATRQVMVTHYTRSTSWNSEEFHTYKDAGGHRSGDNHWFLPGEVGRFPRGSSITLCLCSPTLLTISLPGALPAVSQILYQIQCHHSLFWFLYNLKITVSLPSAIKGREVAWTLSGQNHHILDGFQHFLPRFSVTPGQDIRNQNLPKSLEEQDASWWVTGL